MATISFADQCDSPTVVVAKISWQRNAALHNGIFFSLLVALAAVPLILLRGSPVLQSPWLLPSLASAAVALCVVWRRSCDAGPASVQGWPRLSMHFCLVMFLLAAIALVAFYIPQRQHFWGGYDDFHVFVPDFICLWSFDHDSQNGRPALGWANVFARMLGGGCIEGFLWFAALQCYINALLLWAILQTLLPNARALCLTPAILLIVNRADPLKFYPLWGASNYSLAVGCLLFAIWMFLVSWRRQNRGLLVLACAALGASLLMVEVGYLLAAVPLLLLWIDRKRDAFWKFWAFSWAATWFLFATRVAIFQLTNGDSYQMRQARAAKISLQSLIENFASHLQPTAKYFDLSSAVSDYGGIALLIIVSVTASVWWIGRHDKKPSLYAWFTVLSLSLLGILLGVAPYSHIAGNQRTQFFAAPSQAVFVAFALGLPGYFLSHRIALAVLSIAVGSLSANSAVESFHEQYRSQHVTYDKTVHVCQQIRALSSTLSEDTLILLLHEGPAPLGTSYCAHFGGTSWVGATIEQMGETTETYIQAIFEKKEVKLSYFDRAFKRYSYRRLLIFRLDADGTLYFQPEWPRDARLPQEVSGYAPLTFLDPGAIVGRHDFDFPSWSGPPPDIVQQRDGIVLGRGWSSLRFEGGWLFRDAEQDAELVVNGQGKSSFELDLELGPVPDTEAGYIVEVLDAANAIVATADLHQRQRIHLSVPCDRNRLEVIRLRVNSQSSTKPVKRVAMRVYCSDGPLSKNPLQPLASITSGGVRLGQGWYPCETHACRQLRWLNTDGEILTGPCDDGESPALVLDAAVGPGMNGQPCSIELTDIEGRSLAAAIIAGRERVALALPADLPQGTRLLLKVQGGGKTIPTDPRILNLMITKCEWQSTAIPIPDITATQ